MANNQATCSVSILTVFVIQSQLAQDVILFVATATVAKDVPTTAGFDISYKLGASINAFKYFASYFRFCIIR